MIKVFYGKKGMGKTKLMLDTANSLIANSEGNVVYLDDSNELLVKLSHRIRFINVLDYPIIGAAAFLGFLCGVSSQNYDIETVFIDELTYIVNEEIYSLKTFFEGVAFIEKTRNVNFYISINGDENNTPDFIQQYI